MKIAVAGTGYVGLSIATLLAQHNDVTAVDIAPERVDMVNRRQSPIQDDYIERFFAEDIKLREGYNPKTVGAFLLKKEDFLKILMNIWLENSMMKILVWMKTHILLIIIKNK